VTAQQAGAGILGVALAIAALLTAALVSLAGVAG
jgi:hypothetical protein